MRLRSQEERCVTRHRTTARETTTDAALQFLYKLIPLSMVYRDALLSVAAYASLGGSVAKTFFARADNTASYAGRLNMESLESSS